MPTDNPRIQVMLDSETSGLLATLATRRHRSISATAADLIRESLELQEDKALSRHGDARVGAALEADTWSSHDEAWQ